MKNIKIKLRKEVGRCALCKQSKDFLYLSDFLYGQRLVYFSENKKPAFINLLEDEVFDEYVNMVKSVINEHNISCSSDGICAFVDKSFGIACDMIYGMSVDFLVGQRKCLHCGSIQFERNMIAPASIIEIELPIVSHEKWKRIDCIQKKSIILDELKKDGFIV